MLNKLTLEDYNLSNTQKEFLKENINDKRNIIISGNKKSGKTTFLNACLKELNKEDLRVVIIEDKEELNCPVLNTTKGLTNNQYSVKFLIHAYLKMRPDYVVLGEIKESEELFELLTACRSGHAGITTIRATDLMDKLYSYSKIIAERNVFQLLIADVLNVIVEIENNKIKSIKEILGYNEQNKEYAYKNII